jgi:hypothetical protein
MSRKISSDSARRKPPATSSIAAMARATRRNKPAGSSISWPRSSRSRKRFSKTARACSLSSLVLVSFGITGAAVFTFENRVRSRGLSIERGRQLVDEPGRFHLKTPTRKS